VEYPGSYAEVRAWYPSDAACLDYLDWLRWPEGLCCPLCRSDVAWRLPDGRWSCGRCGRRVSATAGTIFHGTRTPLTVWFAAAWMMVSQKHGISALGLKRALGIGSEQTAWAMLHRYRTAMVRPGRDRLTGVVEVDETFLGGPEPGRRGRGALGKTLAAVAVEQRGRGSGRCRAQRRRQGGDAARVPAGPRPARRDRDHRRMGQLRACVRGRVRASPRAGGPVRAAGARTAARRASRRLAGQALAAGHPSGRRQARAPTGPTSTSSPSASTAGAQHRVGCSSIACSNSPSRRRRARTARWWPTAEPAAGRLPLRELASACARRAWQARR